MSKSPSPKRPMLGKSRTVQRDTNCQTLWEVLQREIHVEGIELHPFLINMPGCQCQWPVPKRQPAWQPMSSPQTQTRLQRPGPLALKIGAVVSAQTFSHKSKHTRDVVQCDGQHQQHRPPPSGQQRCGCRRHILALPRFHCAMAIARAVGCSCTAPQAGTR